MKKSPAGGFAKGATCGSAPQGFEGDTDLEVSEGWIDPELALSVADAIAGGAGASDGADEDDDDGDVHSLDTTVKGAMGTTAVEVAGDACSSCFQAICDNDAYCCETAWDDTCVATGLTICEALCGAEATQPL